MTDTKAATLRRIVRDVAKQTGGTVRHGWRYTVELPPTRNDDNAGESRSED